MNQKMSGHPSSGSTPWSVAFGAAGDIPVPGNHDGDEKADLAIYQPFSGTWFILTSGSSSAAWYSRG